MIKLEKLEKGEFFEDAFLVSYRYNKDYLNKIEYAGQSHKERYGNMKKEGK